MTAPPALLPVPRPKITQSYDQRTVEQSFQSLERDLQQKFDRRGDLVLDPGAELVLTADNSSAQYGIGIDVSGYIRILNYADGSIGTFSVAWAQVDGAAQEITNLTTYVDAADATLQANINTVATTSATNGTAISTLQTEITAAREGEASLLANITDVRTAFASADAAEASARLTLQANLEAADTTLQANIDAEESARVTADTAEAAARTALEANLTKAAVQLTVDNFDADGFYWTRAFGGAPESLSDPVNATYSDVSGIGRVLETSAYALYLTPKAVIKPYVGRKIRVEVKVRATVDPSSGALTATLSDINGLSSAWAHGAPSFTASAVTGYNSSESGLTVSDGWVTLARIYECTALSTYDAGWRPRLDVTHTGSGGTVQVAYFKIEDVTEAQDIRASVTTEEVARIAGDAAEAAARTSLQTTLESADTTLQSNIDAEASARTTADSTAATDRTAIRSEFAAADTTLQANIDTEAGTRATADTAEAAARTSLQATLEAADTTLQGNIDSEASTRASADTTLQANVDAEASARVTADTAEASARETLEANLQNGLTPYTVSTFNADGYHWYGGFGGAPDAVSDPGNCTYADVANVGRVLETSTFTLYLQPKAVVRPYLGMKLRCEVKIRTTSNPSGGGISGGLTLNGLTSAWGHSGVNATVSAPTGYSTSFSNLVVADGWVTIAAIMEPTSLGAGEAAWRPRLDVSRTGSGGTIQVAYFKIEDVTDIYARTEILREAFVDSNGDAYAAIRLVAAASGGTPAIIELKSGDGTSDVRLGGNTEIDGNLVVNGTIQTLGIVANGVTEVSSDSTDAAVALSDNTWTDVASVAVTVAAGETIKLEGSAYFEASYSGGASGSTNVACDYRLVRDSTVLRTQDATNYVAIAGGPGSILSSGRGLALVLDTDSPGAGTYTYKLQANITLNGVGPSATTRDVSNRLLIVTRLKR